MNTEKIDKIFYFTKNTSRMNGEVWVYFYGFFIPINHMFMFIIYIYKLLGERIRA